MRSLARELEDPRQMGRRIALCAIVFLVLIGGALANAPTAVAQDTNGQALGGERGLKLCNTTGSRVGAAIGYKTQKGWISEGWWNVASHTCETLLKGKLINRYYYLYVVDYDRSGEWTGKLYMCTDDKLFTIDGVEKCTERGYKRTGFFEVDTGEEPSWTVRLEDQSGAEAKGQ